MDELLTLDDLRGRAQCAGLNLSGDELQRLLPGVHRTKKQAAELRDLLLANDEPAVAFAASKPALK